VTGDSGDPGRRPVIVWMRRALRVQDHIALSAAAQGGAMVIPVVTLSRDERYRADSPRRGFIRGAMANLDESLRSLGSRLFVLQGDPARELPALASRLGAGGVYATRSYDPVSKERDRRIKRSLAETGSDFVLFKDAVLFEEREILSGGNTPYRVFTPYKRAWLERATDIPRPLPPLRTLRSPGSVAGAVRLADVSGFARADAAGGETAAWRAMQRFVRTGLTSYGERRDLLGVDGTSRLSQHLAAGTLSIRTLYRAVVDAMARADEAGRKNGATYVSELIWREFYSTILFNYPHVVRGPFRPAFDRIAWRRSRVHMDAWREGRTGYPIVDAAMRQLNTEGWMHNRARMIVASFLTKDLHIHWMRGEEYFFDRLIDADIASNNGGWQWTAGTGTDASPWFRIFNPVSQARRFDPDGAYVRRYLPELAGVPGQRIHEPWLMTAAERQASGVIPGRIYPRPIVEHEVERNVTLELFRSANLKPGPAGHPER
jgi:deoxyribodipyrimidine photo-lyase